MQRHEAEAAYREAWSTWLLTKDERTRRRLEQTMDSLQEHIARGPDDPAWKDFAASLPGFLDFWSRWHREILECDP